MMGMLRNLLVERCRLVLREEMRVIPTYTLRVAPGGPRFKPLAGGEPTDRPNSVKMSSPDAMTISVGTTMAEFVTYLNRGIRGGLLDHPVVDGTGLSGQYNIRLTFQNRMNPDGSGGRMEIDYPSALPAQLGLRLEPGRGRIRFLVVVKAEKPRVIEP
jgi:uncharacterized protein (TIGR03435 family)